MDIVPNFHLIYEGYFIISSFIPSNPFTWSRRCHPANLSSSIFSNAKSLLIHSLKLSQPNNLHLLKSIFLNKKFSQINSTKPALRTEYIKDLPLLIQQVNQMVDHIHPKERFESVLLMISKFFLHSLYFRNNFFYFKLYNLKCNFFYFKLCNLKYKKVNKGSWENKEEEESKTVFLLTHADARRKYGVGRIYLLWIAHDFLIKYNKSKSI